MLVRWFCSFLIRVLPLVYALLIWHLSSLPQDAQIDTGLPWDRQIKESLHLVEFGILYLLLAAAAAAWGKDHHVWRAALAVLAGMYGLVDEWHQSYVPTRSASLFDFLKDSIGVYVCWRWSETARGRSLWSYIRSRYELPRRHQPGR
mgnify:CR=1 FL=1